MDSNDYETVFLAQNGNEDAINYIYQKYKPLIIAKSERAIVYATHHGIDINDIMQEAFIGLDEAIKKFSQNTDATFYTFAMVCVERQIYSYLRKMTGGKDRALNEAIHITDSIEKTIDDGKNIEMSFMDRDYDIRLIKKIREELTEFEENVFDMKIKGYSFEEIANDLDKDLKSIYNTFHRIKTKIKKIIELDD